MPGFSLARQTLTLSLLVAGSGGGDVRVVDAARVQGEVRALAAGKVTVVHFFATWCKPCREELPRLAPAVARWRARGVTFLAVSADEPEQVSAVRKMLTDAKARFDAVLLARGEPTALIHAMNPDWGGGLPATFVFDKTGKKQKERLAAIDGKTLDAWLGELTQ
jgi:thiol-disulfide isomerase/thioredoxin